MSAEPLAQGADVARGPRGRRQAATRFVLRNAVIAAMIATFVAFSLAKPDSFFTMLTFKAILRDASPLLIIALGITVVLVVNEFDLSVGGLAGLVSTLAVVGVSGAHFGLPVPLALALAVLAGGVLGSLNGFLIAYLGASSFIVTLGMGTVFNGFEVQILGANTIYEEIPKTYGEIANGTFLGLSNQVFIALGVLLVIGFLLHQFEFGRYLYAIGGNREAARLSGVNVRLILLAAFAIAGGCAAITGILVSAQAGSANPNAGTGFLLPAYAGAFLGSSMWRPGTFTVIGTVLGTLFLQIIGTGLTLFNLSGALVSIIQGGILVAAVLISRIGRNQ